MCGRSSGPWNRAGDACASQSPAISPGPLTTLCSECCCCGESPGRPGSRWTASTLWRPSELGWKRRGPPDGGGKQCHHLPLLCFRREGSNRSPPTASAGLTPLLPERRPGRGVRDASGFCPAPGLGPPSLPGDGGEGVETCAASAKVPARTGGVALAEGLRPLDRADCERNSAAIAETGGDEYTVNSGSTSLRPLGGIGRHARLRILCRKASGFESPSGH